MWVLRHAVTADVFSPVLSPEGGYTRCAGLSAGTAKHCPTAMLSHTRSPCEPCGLRCARVGGGMYSSLNRKQVMGSREKRCTEKIISTQPNGLALED